MSSKNKRQRRSPNKTSKTQKENRITGYTFVSPSKWMAPARMGVTLRFHKFVDISAAAVPAANVRFCPTFVYDVDPTVGSTSTPGFAEWGALYRLYRCQASRIRVSFINNDTGNCYVCYIASQNSDPGNNHSSTVAQTQLSQRLTKSGVVGFANGSSVVELSNSQTTANFGGARNAQITDSYTGTVAGLSPGNNWYWDVGIVGIQNITNGCVASCVIDMDTEFFELTNPSA